MYGANPVLSEALGLDRQWLHAMKLEFRHPRTRVWTTVRSQYPADLAAALDAMRARHIEPAEPAGICRSSGGLIPQRVHHAF